MRTVILKWLDAIARRLDLAFQMRVTLAVYAALAPMVLILTL